MVDPDMNDPPHDGTRGRLVVALAAVSLAAYLLLSEGLQNHLADMRSALAVIAGG
ncbi:hypothetical protein C882_1632 [Caenispirillum salinarum AK4]|uniref:Uncharacterized protein n=1 Tax=Caenispirillum salinarum AK4 TaxID=1238182 RepID=K9H6V6_9PROT|nr:hypothetical protein [Caenispirillum salinarum]EKV32794.1 hypothetical protein C882_1632 [Caenispirillum salinarum AK4]